MSGPMSMYLYIHTAIEREVAYLEGVAKDLKWDDADEVQALRDRLAWFQMAVGKHEEAEEEILFPAMEQRFRFVAETYEFDHDDFDNHLWTGIDAAFEGLARSNGNGREHAELLYRQSVALHEHMRLHIAKENELLIPKLQAEFDISEQAEIAGGMAGVFDPQLMAQAVNFTYGWLSAPDREGMVRFLGAILPPEAFAGLRAGLAAQNPDTWPEVEARISDL